MISLGLKLYLSGPMSGIPQFNVPAFQKAAADLREQGHEVTSPLEFGDENIPELLANPTGCMDTHHQKVGVSYGALLGRDIQVILDMDLDGIVMLDGWEKSTGAKLEVFTAMLKGLPVYSCQGGNIFRQSSFRVWAVLEAEVMEVA